MANNNSELLISQWVNIAKAKPASIKRAKTRRKEIKPYLKLKEYKLTSTFPAWQNQIQIETKNRTQPDRNNAGC